MATVAEIITGVRDLSPYFDDLNTPNAVLLRALARYQDELFGKVADLHPQALAKAQVVAISTIDWSAPYVSLSADVLRPVGGRVRLKDSNISEEEPFHILPEVDRTPQNRSYRYSGYWVGPSPNFPSGQGTTTGFIQLAGQAADWEAALTLYIDYFPRVQLQPSTLASVFELPGAHADVLVAWGGLIAARRVSERVDVAEYSDTWLLAEERYLDLVTGRRRAKVGPATENW